MLAKDLFRGGRAISSLCPHFPARVVRELQGPKNRQIVESNPETVLLEVTHRRRGLHRAGERSPPRAVTDSPGVRGVYGMVCGVMGGVRGYGWVWV